jgi:hypothetical protein
MLPDHETGSHESARRALAECFRSLLRIPAGGHRRRVAEIAGYLFERHSIVDQQGRRAMADAVRAAAAQASAFALLGRLNPEEFQVYRMVGDDEGCSVDPLASQSHVEPLADRWAHDGIIESGLRSG